MVWFDYKHKKTPPGKYAHITNDFLLAEIAQGKTLNQIADDNKIERGSMNGLMAKHGISKKRV